MNPIKDLRTASGMTQKAFSEYFGIPKRNIENWEGGKSTCPPYLVDLMWYKLERENKIDPQYIEKEKLTMEIYYRLDYVTERSSYQFGTYKVHHYDIIAVVAGVANVIDTCECNQWDDEPEDISDYIRNGLPGIFWDIWDDLDPDFDAFFPASEIPNRYPDAIKYNA